jgi:hypothetical protein
LFRKIKVRKIKVRKTRVRKIKVRRIYQRGILEKHIGRAILFINVLKTVGGIVIKCHWPMRESAIGQ